MYPVFLFAFLLPYLMAVDACGNAPVLLRVVNGENATPHSWPWQISLRYKNNGHICGGSLIAPNWVLTAAHCVEFDTNPLSFKVVVGAHYRRGSETPVQETIDVVERYHHEQFSMRHLKHDVALLKLKTPVKLSDKVNTVCLPPKGSKAQAGTQCYITGWGRTVGGGNAADILQQAKLPVANDKTCARRNRKLGRVDATTMICAGGQGKGGCQGDSGGPFVCKEGGKWVLRGAVSWGHYDCKTDYYSVFARVVTYLDWISNKMQ